MVQLFRRPIAVLCVGFLAAFPVAGQDPLPPATGGSPIEPEPVHRWLDEVRAQRQAREERHRSAKEAMDARRRWIDPWGAAQMEAREQEVQRRRDAFLEQIDREREAFRSQVPWIPLSPWPDEITGPGPELPRTSEAGTAGPPDQPVAPPSPYALPGWDNHWYYRGY